MKKSILFLFTALLIVSCKSKYPELADGLYADIQTNRGDILVKLTYDVSPVTVANFVSLAEGTNTIVADSFKGKKFYDGLKFHRVVKDFMIQGGDPTATGAGGPGYKFEDEFNDLTFESAGVLAMANSGPNTNGSQFFITHKETPWLNGFHSIFGKVVYGQAVVDTVAQGDSMTKIEIIRVGKDAKNFNAQKVFSEFFEKQTRALEEKERVTAKLKTDFINKMYDLKNQATELPSGLKIYVVNDNKGGEKLKEGQTIKFVYSGFLADGEMFDSNIAEVAQKYEKFDPNRPYSPIEIKLSKDISMIPGFKEGLFAMKQGDKVVLFIPSHLGYGEQGAGGGIIPPNADLVFEVEIVK